jgi:hypothetical protein
VQGNDRKIYCINLNGEQLWNFSVNSQIFDSPAVYDNKLYFGIKYEDIIYCLNVTNGEVIWEYNTDSHVITSPIVKYGHVYIGTQEKMLCFKSDGDEFRNAELVWEFEANGVSTPAAAYGNIYFGTTESEIYCLNATNLLYNDPILIWNYSTPVHVKTGSPIIADFKIFINGPYELYCLDAIGNGDKTTNLYWKFEYPNGWTNYRRPTIADDKLWMITRDSDDGLFLYGLTELINEAPDLPTNIQGVSEGEVETFYTFTVDDVIDPDGDDILYGWDFYNDNQADSWTENPQKSYSWETIGTYYIKVKAKDEHDFESDWSDPHLITIISPLPKLEIISDTTVIENTEFQVTIKSDQNPIENVEVIFNDQIKFTDDKGIVVFTSPSIDSNTQYIVTANFEGYLSDTKYLTILNYVEQQKKGFVYGTVFEDSVGLENVEITIKNEEKSWVFRSDENGRYAATMPIGNYDIIVSYFGYKTQIEENVLVEENKAINYDFQLTKSADSGNQTADLVDYIIEANKENVAAKIDASSKKSHITFYTDTNINIIESNPLSKGKIKLTYSGDHETSKLFVLIISAENPENVILEFDGEEVEKTNDITRFFSQNNTNVSWVIFPTEKSGRYVVFVNSIFSEHTITVYSIIESFGGITAILFYLAIGISAILLFIVPTVTNFVRFRKYYEK